MPPRRWAQQREPNLTEFGRTRNAHPTPESAINATGVVWTTGIAALLRSSMPWLQRFGAASLCRAYRTKEDGPLLISPRLGLAVPGEAPRRLSPRSGALARFLREMCRDRAISRHILDRQRRCAMSLLSTLGHGRPN